MNTTKHNTELFMKNFLLTDPKVIGISLLFSNEFVQDALKSYYKNSNCNIKSFSISYVRFKPLTSCVVTYKVELFDKKKNINSTMYFYTKAYTPPTYQLAKEKLIETHLNKNKNYSESICFDKEQIILYPYYADTKIRSLYSLLDVRKLRRVIYKYDPIFVNKSIRISHKKMSFEVIRYKPEKRAVLKISTTCSNNKLDKDYELSYYIKCYTHTRGKMLFDLVNQLAMTIPNIVKPLYYDIEKQYMIFKSINSEDVSCLINSSQFDKVNKLAASMIFKIHNTSLDKTLFPELAFSDDNFKATAFSIINILPDSKEIITKIISDLETNTTKHSTIHPVLLHGDYSYEQLLYKEGKLSVLDFDRASVGEYSIDIGNYIAHLLYKDILELDFDAKTFIKEFLDEYEKNSNFEVDNNKLNYWTAVALLQLAVKPFRLFENNWNIKIHKILKVVLDVIENKSIFSI